MMSNQNFLDTKVVLSVAGSLAASAMLVRSVADDFLPHEVQSFFFSSLRSLSNRFSSQLTIVIDEFQGLSLNQVFVATESYLGTIAKPSVHRIKVRKAENDKKLMVFVDKDEEIVDVFDGVEVKWRLICRKKNSSNAQKLIDLNVSLRGEMRLYELSFHKKHNEKVTNSYLPFILERAKAIKEENKVIKLHAVQYRRWNKKAISLDHPMRFDTLAMDSELKKALIEDLDSFMKGKELYRRTGKAWKRGYLLYGPPGTGKSSLIAAMANYLNYDIYDMDLTDVRCNSMMRELLLKISNRAIVVFEDIDCTVKLQNRESEDEPAKIGQYQVTLSGLLNFIDGLLSCCGEERIMVFTTNHSERIDPALLRPGRMDMHIHMSYCTVSAFRQLAYSFHGISDHELFELIEGLIREIEVTPAEVSGELMKSKDSETSLHFLVKYLQNKKMERDRANGEKEIEAPRKDPSMSDPSVHDASLSSVTMTGGSTRVYQKTRNTFGTFYRGRGRRTRQYSQY